MSDQKTGGISKQEAGRRGGRANVERHGRDHFKRIGAKGGERTAERGPEFYRAIGKKGGDAHRDKIAIIKALADALEVAKRGCRQSGELEDSEWEQINSALRLAERLP